jgi:hypothetical protein
MTDIHVKERICIDDTLNEVIRCKRDVRFMEEWIRVVMKGTTVVWMGTVVPPVPGVVGSVVAGLGCSPFPWSDLLIGPDLVLIVSLGGLDIRVPCLDLDGMNNDFHQVLQLSLRELAVIGE